MRQKKMTSNQSSKPNELRNFRVRRVIRTCTHFTSVSKHGNEESRKFRDPSVTLMKSRSALPSDRIYTRQV